jgi:hypothetical protein
VEWEGLEAFRNVVQGFISAAIHSTERFQATDEFLSWVGSKKSGLVKRK